MSYEGAERIMVAHHTSDLQHSGTRYWHQPPKPVRVRIIAWLRRVLRLGAHS